MTHRQRSVTVRIVRGSVRHAVRIVVYGLVGALLMAITLVVVVLERRPDLGPWHTVHLDEEFTADAPVESFDEYLALEERLFTQLDAAVYSAVPTGGPNRLDRYHRGSHADPGRWPTNWNRTFQFAAAEPRAGVLLLHGMSDAPYSMRSLGQSLHAHGATVVGLRVPGHGTAPSGLLRVRWEDMAAAVELAMKHLREQTGEQPLYIVGYSNGGALALLYALSTLTDESLPPVRGLVLISPEIRVTKLAALAAWQERLGRLLGMRKLSWNSIKTEYDPFQYKSFALNAGKQAHRITGEIRTRITELAESGDLDRFPALLAFQSVVDTTVSAPALVDDLFVHLPEGEHDLVLFNINLVAAMYDVLKKDPRPAVDELFARTDLSFAVSLVTNENETSRQVVVRRRGAGGEPVTVAPLGLAWPQDVYSLTHIALPFPPDDPVYGGPEAGESPGVQIGNVVLRGEHGVLQISPADLLRMHWNPFHSYMEQRVLAFMSLSGPTEIADEPAPSSETDSPESQP
ncbi:MAG: alpha/beta hydrolase [Planctomycetota bacterium]|jgi:alpha-beta hydrolase superfamily lysophospholipase